MSRILVFIYSHAPARHTRGDRSVGFCRGSRVEGKMSRVEGKMSRVDSKMSRVDSKMSRVESKMSMNF